MTRRKLSLSSTINMSGMVLVYWEEFSRIFKATDSQFGRDPLHTRHH
jgi:hypothetical protein